MRKRNKVRMLNKRHEHRIAMLDNMITSFFFHEQIETTVAKAKSAAQVAERLITRAKKNLPPELPNASKLHNIRLVARSINNKEVLHKLFDDIAKRFANRNGGYTRIIKLGRRNTDSSEMAILQLVEKKELVVLKEERKSLRSKRSEVSGKAKEKKQIGKERKKEKLAKEKADFKAKKTLSKTAKPVKSTKTVKTTKKTIISKTK